MPLKHFTNQNISLPLDVLTYKKKKHKKNTRYILVKQFQLIGIYDKRKLNLKMCLKVSGSSTHKNIVVFVEPTINLRRVYSKYLYS